MGKIKDLLKKYGLVTAVATAPIASAAGQNAGTSAQDAKGVSVEKVSFDQADDAQKKAMTYLMLLGLPKDAMGQISEENDIIKNVVKNDKGETLNQYFVHVDGWLVMHEVSSAGQHSVKARSANKRLEYEQTDGVKIKGEYSETIGDKKFTSKLDGDIGGKIKLLGKDKSNSSDFVFVNNLPEFIIKINDVYKSNIKSIEKNNTQSKISMAFYDRGR